MLQEKVDHLERKVVGISNQQLSKNLIIAGVPRESKEDCAEISFIVAQKVCPDIKKDEIEEAFRIGKTKDETGKVRLDRPILIKFKSHQSRNLVYKNKKSLKNVTTADIGLCRDKNRIFINENLCHETKELFREANKLKKKNNWSFIWTNFGKIFVKKDEDSDVVPITCIEDLQQIEP